MMRSHMLVGALAAASILATGAASAQQSADGESRAGGSGWSKAALFDGQAMSLANAILAIESKSGGKVLEIRFDDHAGRGVYNAVVSANGALSHARVDARTDEILSFDGTTPDWMLGWEQRADVRSLDKATVPLNQAVATAEKFGVGSAVNAGLAKPLTAENDVLAYNIEIVRGGRPIRVAVDATTNQVIANPDMLDTWSPE